MSLILEALKKSEDKRRLGAAPDLATPFSAPRRRSWVWPLAALIVVACVVAWALRPATPPPAPPATAAAAPKKDNANAAAPTPGQKSGAPLHSVPGNNDVTQTAAPTNLPKPSPPPTQAPVNGQFVFGQPSADGAQGPGETGRGQRRGGLANNRPGAMNGRGRASNPATAVATPAPPKSPVVAATPSSTPPPSAPVTAKPAPAPAVAQAAPPSTPVAATAAAADAAPSRAPKSAATVGLTPPPVATAAKPSAPASSNAQPYSELPFSVRKSLPELKLSMHVYAADPTHRFVVLNDSRLTEGEKTNDEIFVREIRPDGVVLEFQNQRFFYPRDGL